jgi:Flp pilus assembly pilin Flp
MLHYGVWRGEGMMTTIIAIYRWGMRLAGDQRGQDLIEYALVSALVVVAVVSGLAPWVGPTLSEIFSKVGSVLDSTP